jgi:hypothetical protein
MTERKRSFATVDIYDAPEDRILLATSIGTASTDEFELNVLAAGDTIEFYFTTHGKPSQRYWVNIKPIANKAVSLYRKDSGLADMEITPNE